MNVVTGKMRFVEAEKKKNLLRKLETQMLRRLNAQYGVKGSEAERDPLETEMAWLVRIFPAPPGDRSSVPGTHIGQLTIACNYSSRLSQPSSGL